MLKSCCLVAVLSRLLCEGCLRLSDRLEFQDVMGVASSGGGGLRGKVGERYEVVVTAFVGDRCTHGTTAVEPMNGE